MYGDSTEETGNELKSFRKENIYFDVEDGGVKFSEQILEYDVKKRKSIEKLYTIIPLKSYFKIIALIMLNFRRHSVCRELMI
jgi:hypothetical protein